MLDKITKKMYKFLLFKNDQNDATSYYISIIISALEISGKNYKVIHSTNEIEKDDIVITIQAKAFFYVWLKNRKQRIINWFQGIAPEETLLDGKGLYKYLRALGWTFFEYLALKKAYKIFFVSNSMFLHYKNKYGYNKNNHYIMPCFNQELNETAFNNTKYNSPSFVYAGSLSKWQCFDQTLEIFKTIQNTMPNSTLAVLTNEIEKAKTLIDKYKIKNTDIKYIPYQLLNKELAKYKYGFLIRENIPINKVATPTKMNSYMANGIIPIFSDIIGDFKEEFKEFKYLIRYENNSNTYIQQIVNIENQNNIGNHIYSEYKQLFKNYFSKEHYKLEILEFLSK